MAGSDDISTMTKDMLRVYALSNHGVTLDMTQRVADLRMQVAALDANKQTVPAIKVEVEPPSNPEPKGKTNPPFARNKSSGKVYPWNPNFDMVNQWDPVWPEE